MCGLCRPAVFVSRFHCTDIAIVDITHSNLLIQHGEFFFIICIKMFLSSVIDLKLNWTWSNMTICRLKCTAVKFENGVIFDSFVWYG